MSQSSHLIIADTQTLVVEGLKVLLNKAFNTISHVTSKAELHQLLQENPCSLLIVDYVTIGLDVNNELSSIRKTFPDAGIIVLSNNLTHTIIVNLNQAGIKHILHKSTDKEELKDCIEAVKKCRRYYAAFVMDIMMETENKKNLNSEGILLTNAETEIVRLIAEGQSNKQIAQRKTLSIHTVTTHRKNILRKLGVSSASELIMIAVKKGWVDVIDYQI